MSGGLVRLAVQQVAVAAMLAGAAWLIVPTRVADDAVKAIAAVTVAMLIGFGPLRIFLRDGPDGIVAGWIAAMIVRMAATLAGLVVLIRRFDLDPAACVFGVCGTYLVLLLVEAIGLAKIVRREFDNRRSDDDRRSIDQRQATAQRELGER